MKQPLRKAILLFGLSGCAGCSATRAFKPPMEPVEHFSAATDAASAEEIPTPAAQRDETTAEEVDPILKQPSTESWPGASIAEEYCPNEFTDDERQSLPFGQEFRFHCGDMYHCVLADYRNYYSLENLALLGVGFGIGSVVANTDLDDNIQLRYQDDVRSHSTDEFAHVVKYFGEGGYEATIMIAAWTMGNMFSDTRCGDWIAEWGGRGMRTIIVGAPPMLLMQFITGSSRPNETSAESTWTPFKDANGVSGHAFMGAVPFINAAKMTHAVVPKVGLYVCSTFPAWSRVNDNAHFTSQAILGWWMAYSAATMVDWTEQNGHDWHVMPLPMENGAGMAITYQY